MEHPSASAEESAAPATISPPPPREGNLSTVLNGIGNGMMLGAIPFFATEIYSHLSRRTIARAAYITNAVLTTVGGVLGGMYGYREGEHLKAYREDIAAQLRALNTRVSAHSVELQGLVAAKTPTQNPARN